MRLVSKQCFAVRALLVSLLVGLLVPAKVSAQSLAPAELSLPSSPQPSAQKKSRAFTRRSAQSKIVSTTTLNLAFPTSYGWTVTLTTVEVQDNGQFTFNFAYQKSPGATGYISCPNPMQPKEAYLDLGGDTRVYPIDWFCRHHRGESFYDNLNTFASFPGVGSPYFPLTLKWYDWGTLSGLTVNLPASDEAIIDYFALGDSIPASSGGMTDTTPCRRSSESYPWQVGYAMSMRHNSIYINNLACFDATLFEAPDESQSSFDRQVTYALSALSTRPTLVSITYGANEIGLTDPATILGVLALSESDFTHWLDISSAAIRDVIVSEGDRLLRGHTNVRLIITDYGDPINNSPNNFRSRAEQVTSSTSPVSSGTRLKEAEQTLISEGYSGQVKLVSVYPVFQGHEQPRPVGTCPLIIGALDTSNPPDIPDSWFQHSGSPTLPGPGDPNSDLYLLPNAGGCFHPDLLGAAAYASAVNAAAKQLGL